MFVYNLKVNGNIVFKAVLILILIISLILLCVSISYIFFNPNFTTQDTIETNIPISIDSNNYTNVLKEVYDNTDDYVGQCINFTGYVYRKENMKDNEFVLARNMIINSDSQSVVVGFLCNLDNAREFKDGTWVNVSGNIIKGYYHDQIPVIEITEIKEAKEPEDSFVYPPDNTFVPTSSII